MKSTMLFTAATVVLSLAQPALAQDSLAKFIEGFNGVTVSIGPGSDECGIRDGARYADAARKSLAEAGLKQDPVAISHAYVFVWGKAFGPLKQQCAMFVSLRLGTDVAAEAVKIDAKVENDQVLIERATKIEGSFPAAFWISTLLSVKLEPGAAEQATEMLGQLVGDFKKARSG